MPILAKVRKPMSVNLTYPARGRGAWNSKGVGGTLNSKGDGPGRFYRASSTPTVAAPGLLGFRANRDGAVIDIDAYAVWRGCAAIQAALKVEAVFPHTVDGIWGPLTDMAVREFQRRRGITVDGVFGPQSARSLLEPLVHSAAGETDPDHALDIARILTGTLTLESVWDAGAVGSADAQDLGLCQINGPAHPTLSVNDRLNPKMALPWAARLIESNLEAFDYDLRDSVAAFNLGVGGARRWISQGRPPMYTPPGASKPRNVEAYIDKILGE